MLMFVIHYVELYQSVDDWVSGTYTCKLTITDVFLYVFFLDMSCSEKLH